MLKRSITGIIILLATVGFVLLRLVHPLFFDAYALFIIYACVVEVAFAKQTCKPLYVLLFAYPVALALIYNLAPVSLWIILQVASLLLMFAISMAKDLISYSIKRKKGLMPEGEELNKYILSQTKFTMEILVYPTSLLGFLMAINHLGLNIGFIGLIMVFSVTMVTDVFAFVFGSLIKGPKFAPEISPFKTISGMLCGALGGIICGGIGYLLFVHFGLIGNVFASVSLAKKIAIFALIGVVGTFLTQFGDLVESAYKRKLGVKDFGSILPGHGGMMDRVDGLMFTAALVFIVFNLFV